MKIWKASLILIFTIEEKYDLGFVFEEEGKDYRINEKYNEWIYSANWVSNRVPMSMVVETAGYSGIKVVQGFDHELNEDELRQLESDMKEFLIEKLNVDKEAYLQEYQSKIDLIQGK